MAIYADFEIKKESKGLALLKLTEQKNRGNINFLYFLLKLFMQYHECLSKKQLRQASQLI